MRAVAIVLLMVGPLAPRRGQNQVITINQMHRQGGRHPTPGLDLPLLQNRAPQAQVTRPEQQVVKKLIVKIYG